MDLNEVNDFVDNILDDSVADESIAPSDVGTAIKKVAEFTEEKTSEVATPVTGIVKTVITEDQVKQLYTTPIEVLSSAVAGKVRYPINVFVKRNAGDAYTLATNSFSLINDFGTTMSGNLNPNPLLSTSEGYFQSGISVVQNLSGGVGNASYKLKALSGDPTVGTGALEVYVTYVEITL